jgi:hypothetical protein
MTVVEMPQCSTQPVYDVQIVPEQVAVGMLGGEEVEVKASASIECFFLKRTVMQMIAQVEWEPWTKEELDAVPGITGCMVCTGDDLWKIAKRYQTTVNEIMETNNLSEESVQPGDKLLIFKKPSCILNA